MFDEIVKDKFNAAVIYLEKARGIQTKEQRYREFLNLVLKVKLREAVRFVCARETGEFCNPKNYQSIEWELLMKPSHRSWRENMRTKHFLLC